MVLRKEIIMSAQFGLEIIKGQLVEMLVVAAILGN